MHLPSKADCYRYFNFINLYLLHSRLLGKVKGMYRGTICVVLSTVRISHFSTSGISRTSLFYTQRKMQPVLLPIDYKFCCQYSMLPSKSMMPLKFLRIHSSSTPKVRSFFIQEVSLVNGITSTQQTISISWSYCRRLPQKLKEVKPSSRDWLDKVKCNNCWILYTVCIFIFLSINYFYFRGIRWCLQRDIEDSRR